MVDDDQLFSSTLKRNLEFDGTYHVHCENDPRNVIDDCFEEPPDIVLLDVLMPELNGVEVYNAVKSNPRLKHIPVILISGSYPKERTEEGDMVTEHGHVMLTKPVSMDELTFAIRFEIHKSEEEF